MTLWDDPHSSLFLFDVSGFCSIPFQGRAVSLAIFGVSDQIEPVLATSQNRFLMLANRSVDVLTNTVTHTMGRDVHDPISQAGFSFSAPYFYSGLAFGGVPSFVDCADKLDSFYGHCRDMKICVGSGTTHELILEKLLPGMEAIPTASSDDDLQKLSDSTCNVVASEPVSMPLHKVRKLGYDGPWKIGDKIFSKEPLTLVTRQDDAQWSNVINMVVNVFIVAEEKNISKANAKDLEIFLADDREFAEMLVPIVSEFGNYGDLHSKHLERNVPRQGLNSLYTNNDDTGLLYSFPFGDVDAIGPGPIPRKTLDTIMKRGYLRCGLIERAGFAEFDESGNWFGFDVEFCRALSAAIFAGTTDTVQYEILSRSDSEDFKALTSGRVDALAGARVALRADYLQPSTEQRYTFSLPTFYESGDSRNACASATREDDCQWSDFVHWGCDGIVFCRRREHSTRLLWGDACCEIVWRRHEANAARQRAGSGALWRDLQPHTCKHHASIWWKYAEQVVGWPPTLPYEPSLESGYMQ